MDEIYVTVERHDQMIKILERDVAALREVQGEIRSMNQTLLTLANEIKHTNEHLARHERKIEEMDNQPKYRMQQIVTLLYTHSVIVTSSGVRESEKRALTELCQRMHHHIDYYTDNDVITSNFDFFEKVVAFPLPLFSPCF